MAGTCFGQIMGAQHQRQALGAYRSILQPTSETAQSKSGEQPLQRVKLRLDAPDTGQLIVQPDRPLTQRTVDIDPHTGRAVSDDKMLSGSGTDQRYATRQCLQSDRIGIVGRNRLGARGEDSRVELSSPEQMRRACRNGRVFGENATPKKPPDRRRLN